MTKAITIHETGGPEVLRWEEVPLPAPGAGQALVRHRAIGLNYIDAYHRSGLYPLTLPAVLGLEGAGVVEAIGAGVRDVAVGDRVAYAGGPPGAYAESRVMPADRLVPLPPAISEVQAAGMMLKGLTAQYLLRRTFPVGPGCTVLFHAAAGGVGLIACQWAKRLGARVIGAVGSDAKAALARANGCDEVIVYGRENVVARVKELTAGRGVAVVYDSVGKDTWEGSLDCLQPLGMMVSFGNSSGPVPSFSPLVLAAKGSLFLTRPTLVDYTAARDDLLAAARELFDIVGAGGVSIRVNARYALQDAAQAHRDLEARRTTGSSLLLP